MKPADKRSMKAPHPYPLPLPALICLALLAVATPPRDASAAPRVLVEVGERITGWFSKRGGGRSASALDPENLLRGAGGEASTGLRTPGLDGAVARHGDEVAGYVVRVPEAAPLLARRADEVLPLARRYGDDFLRVESRVPGLGVEAAARFPARGDLGRLAALPADQGRSVIGYAGRATDRTAAPMLLKGVERTGGRILEKITPGQILVGGLSTSAVIVAWKAADAAVSSPELFIERVAETLRPISVGAGVGVCGALLLLATGLAAKWGLLGALKRGRSRPGGRGASRPHAASHEEVPLPG